MCRKIAKTYPATGYSQESNGVRRRQLTVKIGLIDCSKRPTISARYTVPSSETAAFQKAESDQGGTFIDSRKLGLIGALSTARADIPTPWASGRPMKLTTR